MRDGFVKTFACLLCFIVGGFFTGCATSRPLEFQVLDAGTQQPLEDVSIERSHIRRTSMSSGVRIVEDWRETDADGSATFRDVGRHHLFRVRKEGYDGADVSINHQVGRFEWEDASGRTGMERDGRVRIPLQPSLADE